jgi:hypothetical protein
MQVTGAVHKIEVRPARGEYPEKKVLILTDRNGPSLSDLSEETYIEVELQGDGTGLKAGDMITFWGRFSWAHGSTVSFQCRGNYKVNGK